MIIELPSEKHIQIADKHLPLVDDLFIRWGYNVESNIKVNEDISSELSAWGVPWKWI